MGYNANGYVSITCTDPTQLTAMALLHERFAKDLTAPWYTHSILQDMQNENGDILLRALKASRFTDGAKQERNGHMVYTAFYDDKWWEGADFVHRLAAESGMKVAGEFRGEDDAEWAWASEGGQLIEEEIIHVTGSKHRHFMQAQEDLSTLHQLLSGDGLVDGETLLRAREILSPYAPTEAGNDRSDTQDD